mmetsp:Transcript_8154/g.14768  ORF Transcript_8154/g.14768 Transcript_8154/m.14768 type:complete len:84 (+) Transcript_8154:110-361(+)
MSTRVRGNAICASRPLLCEIRFTSNGMLLDQLILLVDDVVWMALLKSSSFWMIDFMELTVDLILEVCRLWFTESDECEEEKER